MRNRKGFTLVEVVVVLAILGLLVLIGMPKYKSYVREAELTRLKVECSELGEASMQYYMSKGDWPRQSDEFYSKEEVLAFGERIVDETGKVLELDAGGKYYDLDYEKLSRYISKPEKGYNYVLQNPVGRVYGIEGPMDERKLGLIVKPLLATIKMTPETDVTNETEITWGAGINMGEVVEEEWEGNQTRYPEGGKYVVRLRVKNADGLWSAWVTKELNVPRLGQGLKELEESWLRTNIEAGWQLIDNKNSAIKLTGSWGASNTHYLQYKDTLNWIHPTGRELISFKFYGTQLRYYTCRNNSSSASVRVSIDGKEEYFNTYSAQSYTIQGNSVLVYEKRGLEAVEHTVRINNNMAVGATESGNRVLGLDAIAIDEAGYMLE